MIQSQFVYYINMEKYGFICPTIYKCVRQDFLFLMFCLKESYEPRDGNRICNIFCVGQPIINLALIVKLFDPEM